MDQRSIATATFVQQVDELFDSFNGSQFKGIEGKELKCCITENSAHISYWSKAFELVKAWRYQRRTKSGVILNSKPPSQIGWLTSLRAIKALWYQLHTQKGFSSLRPRSLNQDALENLFGAVRGGCGSNDNPTVVQFSGSLKAQILNGLTNQALSGSNCIEDDHFVLSDLRTFLNINENDTETTISTPIKQNYPTDAIATDIVNAVAAGAIESLSVAYVSGFIAKRLLNETKCEQCSNLLISTADSPHNLFIMYKEWSDDQRLQYPSESLVVSIGHCITLLEQILEKSWMESHISQIVDSNIKQVVSFSWLSCLAHNTLIIDSIIKSVCKMGIPWWCKRQNRQQRQLRKDSRPSRKKLNVLLHK